VFVFPVTSAYDAWLTEGEPDSWPSVWVSLGPLLIFPNVTDSEFVPNAKFAFPVGFPMPFSTG
jgi:hypothetical protein